MSRSSKPSARAMRVWQRLSEWYGARFAEQFGPTPSEDWCELVDSVGNETMRTVMADVRMKHVNHPPTLPEFDAIVSAAKRPQIVNAGPATHEMLAEFVHQNYQLTASQFQNWEWLRETFDAPGTDGKMRHNHGMRITGVIIPADKDRPRFRVMVHDMTSRKAMP